MAEFIAIEIGSSAYTEFKMKDNNFTQTEDGVFLGRVNAKNKKEAEIKIRKENKNRVFDEIVIYEIK